MELQIRKHGTPNTEEFTVVTDKETDGLEFYEEFSNIAHAKLMIKRWNSHDALLDACKAALTAMGYAEFSDLEFGEALKETLKQTIAEATNDS